jgi:prepilin-type N-terminal cleavage/methylation domain-containing protein
MALYIRKPALIRISGFTLVELLIVVSVITIIALAGLTTMTNQTKRARDQKRQADLEQIRAALEMYRLSSPDRLYPDVVNVGGAGDRASVSDLKSLLQNYIAVMPADPIAGRRYMYYEGSTDDNKTYQLCATLETGTSDVPCGSLTNCGASAACNFAVSQP